MKIEMAKTIALGWAAWLAIGLGAYLLLLGKPAECLLAIAGAALLALSHYVRASIPRYSDMSDN